MGREMTGEPLMVRRDDFGCVHQREGLLGFLCPVESGEHPFDVMPVPRVGRAGKIDEHLESVPDHTDRVFLAL